MSDFNSLGLSQPLLDALRELGFVQPTAIQAEAIPYLLAGERDLIGLAQTGTGKTAAFGLPLLQQTTAEVLLPQGLVLAPTRELCMQITKELQSFAVFRPLLNLTPVYGGADIRTQMRSLKKGSQLVVATPGRLRDLIRRGAIDLTSIKVVVLDEADEMLNMGFKEEIDDIFSHVPTERRVWLFSATMPPAVNRLCKDYLQDPHEIKVGSTTRTNTNIEHQLIYVRPRERQEVLRRFLDADPDLYGLVFCRTRAETQNLCDDLQRDGHAADVLNGDLSQAQRDRAMARFRDKRVRILIATDVAARGLDVQGITHVFHLNIPDETAFYNHRSGRTGRAGEKGISILLAHPNDRYKVRRIDKQLQLNFTEVEPPSALQLLEQRLHLTFSRLAGVTPIPPMQQLVDNAALALAEVSREELIQRLAAREMLHLPSAYQREVMRELIHGKSAKPEKSKDSRPGKFQRLFLNVGKKEVADVRDFVDFVSTYGEISPRSIGSVDLRDKHTFFDVDDKQARALVNRFRDAEWDGRPLRMNFDDGGKSKDKKGKKGGPKTFKKKKDRRFGFKRKKR
ncbi:MAG: DEAD/DEAH box helicase [Bacteroidota bacterium]